MTVLIMLSTSSSGPEEISPEKVQALREIEDQFFGDSTRETLQPYQQLLREARQAHARDDFKAERQYYQQVLELLRMESHPTAQSPGGRLEKGVTGSREHDRELEKLIYTVLGE